MVHQKPSDDSYPKILSLRVPAKLHEMLTKLSDRQEGKTLADVARAALERAPEAVQVDFSLYENPDKTLLGIRESLSSCRPLEIQEWHFLADYAHSAYHEGKVRCVNSGLLGSNLRAFLAALNVHTRTARKKLRPEAIQFFLQKLGSHGPSADQSVSAVGSAVDGVLKSLKHTFSERTTAEFYSRCFETFMRIQALTDGLNPRKLDSALRPYLADLITVATFHHRKSTGQPLSVPCPVADPRESPSLPVDHGMFFDMTVQLNFQPTWEDLRWCLTVGDCHAFITGGFAALQDLIRVLVDGCTDGEYFHSARQLPVDVKEGVEPLLYLWHADGPVRFFLPGPTQRAIRAVLERVRSTPEMRPFLATWEERYGCI